MAKSYVSKLTTCPKTAPKANIFWQNIPMGSTVMECGKPGSRYFVVRMATPKQPRARYAVANWGSQDAREAQTYLASRTEWYKGLRGAKRRRRR